MTQNDDEKLVTKRAMKGIIDIVIPFPQHKMKTLKNRLVRAIDDLPAVPCLERDEPDYKQKWEALRVKIKEIYGNTHFTEALHVLEGVQKEMVKLEETDDQADQVTRTD